jgi:hypothetical protein
MAENNSYSVQYNFGDLVEQVAGLKTAVTIQTIIGGAAIAAGIGISWFLISSVMETNRALGKLEAGESVVELLKEIKESIKAQPAPTEQKSEQNGVPSQQQGSLENLPIMMGGWTGVKADSTAKLADVLLKSPAKGPVWFYTDNPTEAAAIKSMIEAQ